VTHVCGCGLVHESLLDLPRVQKDHGVMSYDGEVFLLMNCWCGSTLMLSLVPHRRDVLAKFESEPPEAIT
jgi:hypothetical protein